MNVRNHTIAGCVAALCTAMPGFAQDGIPAPATALSPRWGAAMAYDPGRAVTVMHGGQHLTNTGKNKIIARAGTWELADGSSTWKAKHVTPNPGPRAGASMAWDPIRGELLLYGGSDGLRIFDDLWSWNGKRWQQLRITGTRPPALWHQSMTLDESRREVVMYGGGTSLNVFGTHPANPVSDTWIWNGASWRLAAPRNSPGPRSLHGATYSSLQKSVLVLGGFAGFARADSATWSWNGTDWSKLANATPEPNLEFARLARLPSGTVVALGQERVSQQDYDTWKLSPNGWQRLPRSTANATPFALLPNVCSTPKGIIQVDDLLMPHGASTWRLSTHPTTGQHSWTLVQKPRLVDNYSAIYSTKHGEWIFCERSAGACKFLSWRNGAWQPASSIKSLAGPASPEFGYNIADETIVACDAYSPVTETKVWSSGSWTTLTGKTKPPRAYHARFVYDSIRRRLLFVVARKENPRGIELWALDSTGWQQVTTRALPDRAYFEVAFDSHRDRVVLLGGHATNGICEFDGTSWACRPFPTNGPTSFRMGHGLFYHPERKLVYVIGGYTGSETAPLPSWSWDGSKWRLVTTSDGRDKYSAFTRSAGYDPDRLMGAVFYPQTLGEHFVTEFGSRTLHASSTGQAHHYLQAGDTCELLMTAAYGANSFCVSLFSETSQPGFRVQALGVSLFAPLTLGPVLSTSLSAIAVVPLDAKGNGKLQYRIPNVPGIAGFSYRHAALVFGSDGRPVRFTSSVTVDIEK